MSELEGSIQYLPGMGPKRAALLQKELGIESLSDLIHLYPYRYIDRSGIYPIAQVSGESMVQIRAKVVSRNLYAKGGEVIDPGKGVSELRRASRLSVIVEDSSARMEMVFFKGIKWNWERLSPGSEYIFFGKVSEFNGRLNMVHPEVDKPQDSSAPSGLVGVYPSTEALKNSGVTTKLMSRAVGAALSLCLGEVQETLPDYVLRDNGLVPLRKALYDIHFPKDNACLERARYRLKFEELFLLQLSLLKQKYVRSRGSKGFLMPRVGEDFNACYKALPYSLTSAQQRVIKEIRADLMSGKQMNRLLQGDVGSGKTLVAVLCCLLAKGNGFQSCIMAPTEVLAHQHFVSVSKFLSPTHSRCALLTGSSSAAERRETLAGILDGSIDILIGTHALLEDNVVWKNLGLAIVDEQHRFGVEQRSKLWKKNSIAPHILVMTATPIPRTLAMTLYGDLDVSVIDELPPGRKPVKTICIDESRKEAMYKFIREQIAAGRQAFVVYPLIFESEKLDIKNLEQGYEDIVAAFPLPDYKVAIVHGQQSNEQKSFNMEAFVAGRADILVSTTVIEVGVDVPNASVMVIMSAQRFGLSQLHQLRGRVGRGAEEAWCILVKDHKTSKEAQSRLDLMCSTQDGFELSEQDLRMRGPGDLEGTAQSGLPIRLSIASLSKDSAILSRARDYASEVLERDPELSNAENYTLRRELQKDKFKIEDFSRIS